MYFTMQAVQSVTKNLGFVRINGYEHEHDNILVTYEVGYLPDTTDRDPTYVNVVAYPQATLNGPDYEVLEEEIRRARQLIFSSRGDYNKLSGWLDR